jgi:ribonuclease T1
MEQTLKLGLRLAAFVLCCSFAAGAAAFQNTKKVNEFPVVLAQDLPREARDTLALIKKGGPFPYSKDGTVFSNREHVLPQKSRGYYREYTVKTPKVKHRGARRIVAGGGDYFYTDDHYASFKRIKD